MKRRKEKEGERKRGEERGVWIVPSHDGSGLTHW